MNGELLITLFMILGALGLPGEDTKRFRHTDMCVEILTEYNLHPGKYDTAEDALFFARECIEGYATDEDELAFEMRNEMKGE